MEEDTGLYRVGNPGLNDTKSAFADSPAMFRREIRVPRTRAGELAEGLAIHRFSAAMPGVAVRAGGLRVVAARISNPVHCVSIGTT